MTEILLLNWIHTFFATTLVAISITILPHVLEGAANARGFEKICRKEFSFGTPEIKKQTAAFTIIDAKNTVGAVSATYAKNIAIDKAFVSGIHIITIFRSNKSDTLFTYHSFSSKR